VTAGVDNTKFELVNSKAYGTFTVNIFGTVWNYCLIQILQ